MVRYDPAASYAVQETETVYRQDADATWRITMFTPQGQGPFPAILSVHGGAWNGDAYRGNRVAERELAAGGLVVASIQLRRAPAYKYPASVQDVNFGTRWLKAHASEFNADGNQVGLIGFSSGGHLVALSALRPFDPRYGALPLPEAPDADATAAYVVGCWPVIDSLGRFRYAQESRNERLIENHFAYWVTEEAMREGSPQTIIDSGEYTTPLPPMLIIHGDSDLNVPQHLTRRFTESYRAAGGQIELEYFTNMPHAFFNAVPGPDTDRAIGLIKAFIARQTAAAGAATSMA